MYRSISILVAILVFNLCSLYGQYPVDTIVYNGNPNKFINLVFLGDGYQESELNDFLVDVQNVSDYVFNTSPFKEYENYFNVFAISVPSAESGTDHPGNATDVTEPVFPVASVNTVYNSTFDYAGIHRLLVATNGAAINSVLIQNFPLFDQVLILVNSPHYGGSGGSRAVGSLHSSAPEIMLHEMGHSFANLADEYYAGDQYAGERANMTQETNPLQVKWKNWHGDFGIGIYQHCCGGNSAEWYRPHQGCKMRALGTQYPFCSVCTETIVERIHQLFGNPVTSYSPAEATVSGCGQPMPFVLDVVAPVPNTLGVTWTLNGEDIAFDADSISVLSDALNAGGNTLRVEVVDNSDLTRSNSHPDQHTYTISWTINYEPVPEPVITPDGPVTFCDGGQVMLTCDPAHAYLWSTGDTVQSVIAFEDGIYEVTITNAYGCTAASAPVEVEVLPAPEALIIEGDAVGLCSGEAAELTAATADYYQWSTGETSQQIIVSDPGQYTVTVTNIEGCSSVSEPTTVSLQPAPDASISPDGMLGVCDGDTITLSAAPGLDYLWSNGETGLQIAVADSGSFALTVTDGFGCEAESETVTVFVLPVAEAAIAPGDSVQFCAGDSALLVASPAEAYAWSTGDTSAMIVVKAQSNYTVTVTNTFGCQDATSVDVTVHPAPETSIAVSGSLTFCPGDSVTLTADAGYMYAWSTGDTTQSVTLLDSATIVVTLTSAEGCIAESETMVVSTYPLPQVPVITAEGNVLMSSAADGNQWFLDDTLLAGGTGQHWIAVDRGLYTVAVTDTNGCVALSEPFPFFATGTSNPERAWSFSLVPNPGDGLFTIATSGRVDGALTVYDTKGGLVVSFNAVPEVLDLRSQPSGSYVVVVETRNDAVSRVVVVR